MNEPLPILLIPGLTATPLLYAEQLHALWQFGPVTVADHTRDETMTAIAARILRDAPPRFALIGLSMGGYVSFEIIRQAPGRVAKLALLDTSARADTPEQRERRDRQIEIAQTGRFADIVDLQFPMLVHRDHVSDARLKDIVRRMTMDVGAEAFVRQMKAIKGRADSRAHLVAISCPTLVVVGEGDQLTPPVLAEEIASGISGSTLVVVPDCGHLSTLEQPQAVTDALVAWLRR